MAACGHPEEYRSYDEIRRCGMMTTGFDAAAAAAAGAVTDGTLWNEGPNNQVNAIADAIDSIYGYLCEFMPLMP